MAEVRFIRVSKDNLDTIPIVEGQFIVTYDPDAEDNNVGAAYVDHDYARSLLGVLFNQEQFEVSNGITSIKEDVLGGNYLEKKLGYQTLVYGRDFQNTAELCNKHYDDILEIHYDYEAISNEFNIDLYGITTGNETMLSDPGIFIYINNIPENPDKKIHVNLKNIVPYVQFGGDYSIEDLYLYSSHFRLDASNLKVKTYSAEDSTMIIRSHFEITNIIHNDSSIIYLAGGTIDYSVADGYFGLIVNTMKNTIITPAGIPTLLDELVPKLYVDTMINDLKSEIPQILPSGEWTQDSTITGIDVANKKFRYLNDFSGKTFEVNPYINLTVDESHRISDVRFLAGTQLAIGATESLTQSELYIDSTNVSLQSSLGTIKAIYLTNCRHNQCQDLTVTQAFFLNSAELQVTGNLIVGNGTALTLGTMNAIVQISHGSIQGTIRGRGTLIIDKQVTSFQNSMLTFDPNASLIIQDNRKQFHNIEFLEKLSSGIVVYGIETIFQCGDTPNTEKIITSTPNNCVFYNVEASSTMTNGIQTKVPMSDLETQSDIKIYINNGNLCERHFGTQYDSATVRVIFYYTIG